MKKRHLIGFTLIELLVVIAIIGILAALLQPAATRWHRQLGVNRHIRPRIEGGVAVNHSYIPTRPKP